MNMTERAIEALSDDELTAALSDRGVDTSNYEDKEALIRKALTM